MYCVIAGDIVKSRDIDANTRERILRASNDVFDQINTEYMPSLMAAFGMVRGDAFEGILFTQYQAPEIVQKIIKAFYRVEKTVVRISVVMGSLVTTGSDRNEADGPAFHAAVSNLEKMKARKSCHWLQVSFDLGSVAQPIVDSQLTLLSALTQGWTERQREIVWELEANSMQQKLVAKSLGISASAVNKQLKAANYEAYSRAWKSLESYLASLEEQYVDDGLGAPQNYAAYYSVSLRRLKQRNYSEALSLAEKALELAKSDLGSDHPQLASIHNLLAEIFTGIGNFGNAEKAIQESIRLQEKLPRARLKYAETLQKKALICYNQNFYDAEDYMAQALDAARNTVSEGHPYISALSDELKSIRESRKKQLVSL